MSAASVVNLVIEKGTDFEASFFLTGDDGGMLNLLYTTAYAKIRKHPTSPKYHSFNVGITTSEGEVTISMGRSMTSDLSSGRNYFDVFIENTELNFITRVITGSIIVEDTTI